MSSLVLSARNSIDAIVEMVNSADMQGRSISFGHLRSVCMDDFDIDLALRMCDKRGVEVKGRPRQRGYDSITYVPAERGQVWSCFSLVAFIAWVVIAFLVINTGVLAPAWEHFSYLLMVLKF